MIRLKKIDSAELGREVSLIITPGADEAELAEALAQKTALGFYETAAASKTGDYAIYDDERVIGKIGIHAQKSKNFSSSGMADIEFSRTLAPDQTGRGVGTEALRLALQTLNRIETSDFPLECVKFVEYANTIEKFTCNSLGKIYAYVDSLINYPSLASNLKNGGKICAIGGNASIDGILVIFSDTDESEAYTADFINKLKDYSKFLCQENWPKAIEKAKELIRESKDAYTKIVIAQSVQGRMRDLFSEISSDSKISAQLSEAGKELSGMASLDFDDLPYFENALRTVKRFSLTPAAQLTDAAAYAASGGGGATDYQWQAAEDRSELGDAEVAHRSELLGGVADEA